jgi:transcriptional regulator with XRE-family HTH domain
MMKIGEVLRTYRLVAELRQSAMADEIGVSKATLSRIERVGEMDGATLAKVLKWLLAEGE